MLGWLAGRGIEGVTGDEKMGSPSGPLLEWGDGYHAEVAILLITWYSFPLGVHIKLFTVNKK